MLRFWQEILVRDFNATSDLRMPAEYPEVCREFGMRPDPSRVLVALEAAAAWLEPWSRSVGDVFFRWWTPYYPIRSDADLRDAAMASRPLLFRWLPIGLPRRRVDPRLRGWREWEEWKAERRWADRICPFRFNRNSLAMRAGYVIVRRGRPPVVIVTELS